MKLNNVTIDSAMIRVIDIIAPILEKKYSNSEIEIKDNDIFFSVPYGSYSMYCLGDGILKMQKYVHEYSAHRIVMYHCGNRVRVQVIPFFEGAMLHNGPAIRKAVLHAVNNTMPKDNLNLNDDIDEVNFESEDGIGIEAKYEQHTINFKIEGIDYKFDPSFGVVPTKWYAHGCMDDFHVELIAGSEAHAFSKIIKTFYRKALDADPGFANKISSNQIRWRTYGYCY